MMGIDVMIIYFLFSIFYACFNRIMFYDIPNADLEDSEYVWLSYSNRDFASSFVTVLQYFPASNFPDYMVALNAVSKWKHIIQIIELFFNNSILLSIVMSSFYFYYTNFYLESVQLLKEDEKLYYLLYQEFIVDNYIHPKVLNYIVKTHMESEKHCFDNDEQLTKMKIKYEDAAKQETFLTEKRRKLYERNLGKFEKFRKSIMWRLVIFSLD